ncbi:hypothetical protein J6E39_05545 [bacterium]|nr:hypothetical protein [bacterium]
MGDLTIGNVSFYKDDIKSSSVVYQNGEKLNCVFLKNGTKMWFKDQEKDARAGVDTGRDAGNNNKYGTGFSNIKGLTIEGSDKEDYYHVFNCEDYNVFVQDGQKDEVRVVDNTKDPKSRNGNIYSDTNDNVNFVDARKAMSMSEGWFIRNKPTNE